MFILFSKDFKMVEYIKEGAIVGACIVLVNYLTSKFLGKEYL